MNWTWTDYKSSWHVCLLEVYAVYLSLKQIYSMGLMSRQHVLVSSNNICIKKQGDTLSFPLLCLSHSLLLWSSIHLLSFIATHNLGILKSGADFLLRGFLLASGDCIWM